MNRDEFHKFMKRVADFLPDKYKANYSGKIYGPGFVVTGQAYQKIFRLKMKPDWYYSALWLTAIARLEEKGGFKRDYLAMRVPIETTAEETAKLIMRHFVPIGTRIVRLVKEFHKARDTRNVRINSAIVAGLGARTADPMESPRCEAELGPFGKHVSWKVDDTISLFPSLLYQRNPGIS